MEFIIVIFVIICYSVYIRIDILGVIFCRLFFFVFQFVMDFVGEDECDFYGCVDFELNQDIVGLGVSFCCYQQC